MVAGSDQQHGGDVRAGAVEGEQAGGAAGKRFAGHAVYHWDDSEAFTGLGMAEMCLRVAQNETDPEVKEFEAEGLEPWRVPGEDGYECPHDVLAATAGSPVTRCRKTLLRKRTAEVAMTAGRRQWQAARSLGIARLTALRLGGALRAQPASSIPGCARARWACE